MGCNSVGLLAYNTQSFTYPTPFAGAIPSVILTVANNSAGVASVASESLLGFTYNVSSSSSSIVHIENGVVINWIAMQSV